MSYRVGGGAHRQRSVSNSQLKQLRASSDLADHKQSDKAGANKPVMLKNMK